MSLMECLLAANGWIAGSRHTKVLESWPKGFWYGVSSTEMSTSPLEKLFAVAAS